MKAVHCIVVTVGGWERGGGFVFHPVGFVDFFHGPGVMELFSMNKAGCV